MTTKSSAVNAHVLPYALYGVEPREFTDRLQVFPCCMSTVVEAEAYTVTISQHDGQHGWYCCDDESTILTLDTPYEYPFARV